jgi:hypothetical protein
MNMPFKEAHATLDVLPAGDGKSVITMTMDATPKYGIFGPIMGAVMIRPMMGMDGPNEPAARRYLDAAGFGDDQTGGFYATEHRKKGVGEMAIQTWPEHFTDQDSQEIGFDTVVKMTGFPFPGKVQIVARSAA